MTPHSLTPLDGIDLPLPPLAPSDPPDRHVHRPSYTAPAGPRPSGPLHVLRLPIDEIARFPFATTELPTPTDLFLD